MILHICSHIIGDSIWLQVRCDPGVMCFDLKEEISRQFKLLEKFLLFRNEFIMEAYKGTL